MNHQQPLPTTSNADVGAVLESLRAQVCAQRLAHPVSAYDGLQRDLQRALDDVELHRVVSAHWPLIGHSLASRVIAVVNKLVRRYLRWYINPIVEQQNAYNDTVARTLRLLADAYADLDQTRQATDGGSSPVEQKAQDSKPTDGRQNDTEHGDLAEATPPVNPAMPKDVLLMLDRLPAVVRVRAAQEPPAHFPDLELGAQELQLQLHQQVVAHWPMPARTLRERVVVLLNKLVRRYLRWYINPIVEQQNAANVAITAALLAAVRLDAERRASAAARRARQAHSR